MQTTVPATHPLSSEISTRKAQPAIDRAAAMAHQAVDRAAGAAAPTADWLTERGKSLNAAQEKLVAGASNYVSTNPLKALGITLAAGFLLSRIMR